MTESRGSNVKCKQAAPTCVLSYATSYVNCTTSSQAERNFGLVEQEQLASVRGLISASDGENRPEKICITAGLYLAESGKEIER